MKDLWHGFTRFIRSLHPIRLVTLGYLSYVLAGWILLSLPFTHTAKNLHGIDALFTAASAMSTTGLVTVSTGNDYNLVGQIIILVLIQLGGIGYMTFGSFVMLSRSGTLSERRQQIGTTVFSMPAGFQIDKFIKSVIVFSVLTEVLGAVALYSSFLRLNMPHPLWSAIFHSISAFCTAGFSLYDSSFMELRNNVEVNAILGILSYLGAMGFIVFVDVWRRITGKVSALTLTTRIIIVTTTWISVVGTLLFFICEPSIQELPAPQRLLAALFQVMTSITTVGFNTIDTGGLSPASLFLIIMLMVIGASPAGTGGGLKTTTFTALFGAIRGVLKGKTDVTFWGRTIPMERVRQAMATLGFYASALIVGCYLLALTEKFAFEKLMFEAASALGTVGLSTGITPDLSPLGKLIITGLMFLGRLGPLAFGMALFLPSEAAKKNPTAEPDDIAL
ncbi:MAG: hypothetical protein K9M54_09530 [Kiritimatiellales bacterium]|nr:hypothetical protein [Kiritimatiellales bacterium]